MSSREERPEVGRRGFLAGVGILAGVAASTGVGLAVADAVDPKVPVLTPDPEAGDPAGAAQVSSVGIPEMPERDPAQPAEARVSLTDEPLLGHIRAGDRIDRWSVEAVHGIRMGAVPVVLRTADGGRFQVDILRRDPNESGVDGTPSLSLFLANRGNGGMATHEEHGLGLMALAARMRDLEGRGARPPRLLTLAERRFMHPLGAYNVLV